MSKENEKILIIKQHAALTEIFVLKIDFFGATTALCSTFSKFIIVVTHLGQHSTY
jgi:hypothetical protein